MQASIKLKSNTRLEVENLTTIKHFEQGTLTDILPQEFICTNEPYLFVGSTRLAVHGNDIEFVVIKD